MARSPASFKEDVLNEFGKVNFLRVGNFLPASVFLHSCNKYTAEDCEPYWAAIEELVMEGAMEKVSTPMEGYRLTQAGYDFVTHRNDD